MSDERNPPAGGPGEQDPTPAIQEAPEATQDGAAGGDRGAGDDRPPNRPVSLTRPQARDAIAALIRESEEDPLLPVQPYRGRLEAVLEAFQPRRYQPRHPDAVYPRTKATEEQLRHLAEEQQHRAHEITRLCENAGLPPDPVTLGALLQVAADLMEPITGPSAERVIAQFALTLDQQRIQKEKELRDAVATQLLMQQTEGEVKH
jgi:hypothetical protein